MLDLSQKSVTGKVYSEIIKNNLFSPGEKIAVAVSGGADSICLLSVLLELRDKLNIELSTIHFNHRLRGRESDQDAEFVRNFCDKRGIECTAGQAVEENKYKSEDEARVARYAFFEKILAGERADKIATAHTQNDSAETVLLRLIRGSGFRGLKSIPLRREKICRPLLSVSRSEVEGYLSRNNLSFRTDSSNSDLKFARNKIRHLLLPQITELNPNAIETLANSAKNFEDDYDYIEESGLGCLESTVVKQNSTATVLDYKKWCALHPAMKKMVLRLAIARISELIDITTKQLQEVVYMLESNVGKKHKLLPHSLRISLENDKIKIEKSNQETR